VSESLLKAGKSYRCIWATTNLSVHPSILLSLTLWWLSLAIRSRLFDSGSRVLAGLQSEGESDASRKRRASFKARHSREHSQGQNVCGLLG
jgi:hypothetical protein